MRQIRLTASISVAIVIMSGFSLSSNHTFRVIIPCMVTPNRMTIHRPYTCAHDLICLLQSRELTIADTVKAESYLEDIGCFVNFVNKTSGNYVFLILFARFLTKKYYLCGINLMPSVLLTV